MNKIKYNIAIGLLLALISSHNSLAQPIDETFLLEIRNQYFQKQEDIALGQLDEILSDQNYLNFSKQDLLSLLRWKVRIHHKLRQTHLADSVLKYMFSLDDDLDYERFEDKQAHFRLFFDKTYKEYDQGFVFVNKYKEDADSSPAAITIFTRKDIDELGARNLIDLLRITPGFAELGDNNERNIGTRGVFGTTVQHILFLINGHRVNDLLTSSNAPDWFSLDYVEQIEIMRGPGSALYGGSAFSGVVNIITKSAKTFEGSQIELRAGSAQLFSDFLNGSDHQYKLNFQYGTRLQNRDKLYLSGTVRYSGGSKYDYSDIQQDQSNPDVLPDIINNSTIIDPNSTGTEYINKYLPSYNFLGNYNNDKLDVTFNAQSSTFIIHRPSSGNLWLGNSNDAARTRYRKDQRQFIKLNYDLLSSRGITNALSLKMSYDHFLKDFFIHKYSNYNTDPADTSLVRLKGDEFRWTTALEYNTEKLSIFGNKQSSERNNSFTIMGVQGSITDWFYNYMVSPESPNIYHFDPGSNFFEKQADNENTAAFFFQSSQHIINNRLISTIGFRLNYHPIYSNFTQFRWGDEISPRISMVYLSKPNAENLVPIKVKLLYNSAFLPPAFLYRRGGISGFQSVQNLQSQKIESVEISLFGEIYKDLNYSINHFTNKVDQFILRSGTLYENESDIRRLSGWEASIEYITRNTTSQWTTKSFLNFATTKLKTSSDPNAHVLKSLAGTNFSNADLTYYPLFTIYGGFQANFNSSSQSSKGFQGGMSFNYQGKTKVVRSVSLNQDTNEWESGLQNEYSLSSNIPIINLNIKKVTQKMSMGISVHNIMNTRYRLPSLVSRTGEMLGEKRTILLSLSYFFGSNPVDL